MNWGSWWHKKVESHCSAGKLHMVDNRSTNIPTGLSTCQIFQYPKYIRWWLHDWRTDTWLKTLQTNTLQLVRLIAQKPWRGVRWVVRECMWKSIREHLSFIPRKEAHEQCRYLLLWIKLCHCCHKKERVQVGGCRKRTRVWMAYWYRHTWLAHASAAFNASSLILGDQWDSCEHKELGNAKRSRPTAATASTTATPQILRQLKSTTISPRTLSSDKG